MRKIQSKRLKNGDIRVTVGKEKRDFFFGESFPGPVIVDIESDNFGSKRVTLLHTDGRLEFLIETEGQHHFLDQELRERGLI